MGAIAALTAVGVGSQLITANAESKAIKSQSQFQAQQLEGNAALSEIQAQDAIKRGQNDARRLRIQTRQSVGSARAALAAQGQDLASGDALAIQQDLVGFGAEDEETIKNNAWREAFGYRSQAAEQTIQAGFTRSTGKYRAKQAILTGGFNALNSVATGYYYSQKGVPTTTKSEIEKLGG